MHINLKCFTGLILFIYLSNAVKEAVSQTRNSVPNYYAPWDNQYATNNQWVRYTKPSRRRNRQSVPSEYLQSVVKYSPWENYRARSIGNDYESAPLQLSVGERTKDELVFTDKANVKGNSGEDVESGRHIRPQTLFTITETLGALNTVGHYLVNMTRSTSNETAVNEDIPAALYTISKNVLGRNVTDTIAPLVREVLPSKVNTGKVTQTTSSSSNNDNTRSCTTPEGTRGLCDDLSNCPQLLLNLGNLRQSLCFKSLFVPGVCCPIDATVGAPDLIPIEQDFTTRKPIQTTATLLTTTYIPPVLKPKPKPIPNNISLYVDAEECGQPESAKFRVIGGEEALPGRWPWMAAIFLHGPRRTEFWCGGSLITSKHVLTAAHCTRDTRQRAFSPRQFTVRLGDIDLKRDDEPSDPVTFRIADVRAHPRFSRVGFYNDIALFFLESPARKSRYIKPLCLPQPSLRSELFAGQRPTVVGWGTTYYGGKESTVQRQAVLPVWRNEDCNQAYFQPITENFICAGYSEGGVDACQGDSGGPLMLQWNGRWTQIGIVSFGNKCGEPGYPGVYTRVTNYIDWIHANTGYSGANT